MKRSSLPAILIIIGVLVHAPLAAQDNGSQIAALELQKARILQLKAFAGQEAARKLEQALGGIVPNLDTWKRQRDNLDQQITRLDQQIASATDSQKQVYQRSLEDLLKQRANVDAEIVRLTLQVDAKKSQLQSELGALASTYDVQIAEIDAQIQKLTQVNCCMTGGRCERISRADCAAQAGTEVTNCEMDCALVNCCVTQPDGSRTCERVPARSCTGSSKRIVTYCAYECQNTINCMYDRPDPANPGVTVPCCDRMTAAECELKQGRAVESCGSVGCSGTTP